MKSGRLKNGRHLNLISYVRVTKFFFYLFSARSIFGTCHEPCHPYRGAVTMKSDQFRAKNGNHDTLTHTELLFSKQIEFIQYHKTTKCTLIFRIQHTFRLFARNDENECMHIVAGVVLCFDGCDLVRFIQCFSLSTNDYHDFIGNSASSKSKILTKNREQSTRTYVPIRRPIENDYIYKLFNKFDY